MRKWYFKNPHPKRPQFASEFPWLICPGWHCRCAFPDGTPPAYNSVVPVGCADSRCFQVFNGSLVSACLSYGPWHRMRLLPAGHTLVAERCTQPHFGCSSQLGEYPAMTLSRSSALGKRHENGFVLIKSGPKLTDINVLYGKCIRIGVHACVYICIYKIHIYTHAV